MNISAQVLDSATKKPVSNVNINVNGVFKTKTDASGKFTITGIDTSDVVETSFVGYAPFFTTAISFPKTVNIDNTGYALNEVVVKNVFKKTNWLLWLVLGIGVTGIYAYKYNQDNKKDIVKAKI